MKNTLLFIFLLFHLSAPGQRPDLTMGATINIRYLHTPDLNVQLAAPGLSAHLQVSKRSKFVGLVLGGWSTSDLNNAEGINNFHHLHLDFYTGMMIFRKPGFKLSFYPIISNAFSLVGKDRLEGQSVFNRYNMQAIPELSVRYKNVLIAVNYSITITGETLLGPGFKAGISF